MSMVAASSIDWTQVLTALIVGAPAIIAAIYSARIHGQIKTPSGKTIGEVAEYTHDTSIANNMLLSQGNGPTKHAAAGELRAEGKTSPRVPDDEPVPPTPGGS